MALSGLVPRHGRAACGMRTSSTQLDLEGKESYFPLQGADNQYTDHCLPPSAHQLKKDQELPTFIAPQTQHKKKQFKLSSSPDTGRLSNGEQNRGFCNSDAYSSIQRVNSMREPLQPKSKKKSHVVQELFKHQKVGYKKIGGGHNVYGVVVEQGMSVHNVGAYERHRHSSASSRDMICRDELLMTNNKPRLYNNRSWEEEVREALSRNISVNKKQPKDVHKPTRELRTAVFQRSRSVREYNGSDEGAMLPPTLLVKKTNGRNDVFLEERGAKFMEDEIGPRQQHKKGSPEHQKGIWRGFSVKSPSEERWEEAERQEMQRRLRSQSMRHENFTTEELGISTAHDGCRNDEEWAVYTRSGYVNVRPHRSSANHAAAAASSMPCCGSSACSVLGRSLSMRDTSMGLVMECAACGTALQGAGARLLCVCSCCAAAHACNQATPPTLKKRGGGGGAGILHACRRLLGLAKKCTFVTSSSQL